jgi:hypothetical protein
MPLRLFALVAALMLPLRAAPESPQAIATEILAPLLDPVKVATLKGDRPANTRLYKVLYWLETARRAGGDVSAVLDAAQVRAHYAETPGARADKIAISGNRKALEDFGCFTVEGMAKLRKGGSPTITQGPHAGDSIALDHVLPRSVVPELAARFYNLEAIASRVNLAKSATITRREVAIARRWRREELLSSEGLGATEAAAQ